MKRVLIILGILSMTAMATDFSQMSTEELIALRGTVTAEEKTAFKEEMKSRMSSLSQEERQALVSHGKGAGKGKRNGGGRR